MKKLIFISILIAAFATKSFAYCPIPQWCPSAPLDQTLCAAQTIEPIEIPSVIGRTLIITWWSDFTRSESVNTPPGISVSGASALLGEREYGHPIIISGRPNNAGTYHYTVSNLCGQVAISGSITLGAPTPATPGTITFSPTTVCPGGAFTANIAAVSGAATYNWTVPGSMTHDGSDGTTIDITNAGTTTGTLAISVTATNACGTSAASTQNITVNAAPTIGTVTPTGDQNTEQNIAFASTLTVSSTGTPTPTIQWYSNTTASTTGGSTISGATGNTFTPPSDAVNTTGVYYYAVATNSCGTATTSNTSGKHIVIMPPLPAQGCDLVIGSRDNVTITSASFATAQTWSPGTSSLVWSDAVTSPQCTPRGDSYNGGVDPNFNVDCRAPTNGFNGHYFSWCAVMKYAHILCPGDWRVPTTAEFLELHLTLGHSAPATQTSYVSVIANTYMGTTGTGGASGVTENHGGTWGGSRFTAIATIRTDAGSFYWSSSEASAAGAFLLYYVATSVGPQRNNLHKGNGFALRCVRDVP